MFNSSRPLDVLRSVICLTLLGVGVMVFIGPALAVAGTLLPFVLTGALTWGVYRFTRTLIRRVRNGRQPIEVIDVAPAPTPAPAIFRPVVEEQPRRSRPRRFGAFMRTAMHIGVEVGCGAALGAALSVLVDWQTGAGIERPVLGAIIGAVVGFVVGGTRSQSAADRMRDEDASASQAA